MCGSQTGTWAGAHRTISSQSQVRGSCLLLAAAAAGADSRLLAGNELWEWFSFGKCVPHPARSPES